MANDRFKRMFDQVRPSPEQEEAMLARLLLEEEKEARPMRRNWRRTAVFAVIAALLLAAAAFAVATVLDPAFLEHFGAGPKDEPLLGKTAVDVGLTAEPRELVYVEGGCTGGGSATEDIGTFFIRQAVVDRYSAKFLVDYTAPEGMVLDGDYYYPGLDYVLRGEEDWDIRPSSWVPKWEMVEDEDPSDGRITMLLTLTPMSGSEQLSGRRLLISFRRLCAAESWEKAIRGERTVVVDGLWYFPMFTLPEEDPGVAYEIGQPVTLWDGSRVTLDAVYVSPISLGCDLSDGADSLLELDGTREAEWADSVALVTKKGERIPVVDASQPVTGVVYGDNSSIGQAHFYYRPERIIDPAEITAVEFFGQTIPLK